MVPLNQWDIDRLKEKKLERLKVILQLVLLILQISWVLAQFSELFH